MSWIDAIVVGTCSSEHGFRKRFENLSFDIFIMVNKSKYLDQQVKQS